MAVPSRKCPSCGIEVSLLAHGCACGHTFEEPRSPSTPVREFRLHRFILAACRALCLIAAVLAPFVYLAAAIMTRNYLIVVGAPIAFVFLMGSYYIFKAVQIIIDRDEGGRW